MQLEIQISTEPGEGWQKVNVEVRDVDEQSTQYRQHRAESALVQTGLDVNDAIVEMIERLLP